MSKKKKQSIKIDIIGKKFGRLTVIKKVANIWKSKLRKRGFIAFLCKCECNNEKIVAKMDLISKNTKSCGCLKNPYTPSKSTAKEIWRKRYNDGGLTFEQFLDLSQMNCFYCNSPPSNKYNKHKCKKDASKYAKNNGDFIYNGLDRVNSDLPHNIDNVVPCCFRCNSAKNNMTKTEFKKWIIKVYKYFVSK